MITYLVTTVNFCDPKRITPRTWDKIVRKLERLAELDLLPDLEGIFSHKGDHIEDQDET